jgi:hypothetical protein
MDAGFASVGKSPRKELAPRVGTATAAVRPGLSCAPLPHVLMARMRASATCSSSAANGSELHTGLPFRSASCATEVWHKRRRRGAGTLHFRNAAEADAILKRYTNTHFVAGNTIVAPLRNC